MTTKQVEQKMDTIEALRGNAEDAIDAYREALDSLATAMDEYSGDKSDKWLESDKGSAWVEFTEELESCRDSLDDVLDDLPQIGWD